ncbi:hypothetical protein [Sinorhizobium meliloti]|uniref:hypothetical protein n=1 Tax=Rhizobium meliloti TaxID=382 RepID=UPI000FD73BC2|nr:hypothetical protein [Sinorhizobium meliloti]RVI30873.1 hypothetical protein CN207_07470 [Sinorhizobium meliloti]
MFTDIFAKNPQGAVAFQGALETEDFYREIDAILELNEITLDEYIDKTREASAITVTRIPTRPKPI